MLELAFLLQLCVVYALPPSIARATSPSLAAAVASRPTPPPAFHHDLLKRELPSSVCGWVDGRLDSEYYCDQDGATCLWDNVRKTVGCGNADSMPSVTSCYDYASRDNCDEKCKANSENFICSSSAPYCNTVAFPDSFSMVLSCSDKTSQEITVAVTYASMHLPVNLPRSIVNGVVAVQTQFPADYSATSAAAAAASASAAAYALAHQEGEKINVGSIIAAAVGGAVLLAGLPFGIKMFLRRRRWSKAQRPRRLQEREMRRQWAEPSNPYARSAIPDPPPPAAGQNFLFSQDWHGRSKPGTTAPATNS